MAKKITKDALEVLIDSRLSMQSTQRNLLVYGVTNPSLEYILSDGFRKTYENLHILEKQVFLHILAGPIFWKAAKDLIEGNKG